MLLPEGVAIGLSPTVRFSDFVNGNLLLLEVFASEMPDNARLPESWLQPYARHWVNYHLRMGKVVEADSTLFDIIGPSAWNIARKSPTARRVLQLLKKTGEGMAWIDHLTGVRMHEDKLPPARLSKKELAEVREIANMPGMQSEIEGLRKRLKQVTAQRGMKTSLAVYLSAPLPCVSDWLSGKREPGGETTLRLLRWVEQQERQQNEGASSATTPPTPKAQSKASNEKKPQSGRKKQ